MRFYTDSECNAWLTGRNRQKPGLAPDLLHHRASYPPQPHRFYSIAHWIAANLTYRRPALLWITESEIWPSSENWHLYYKLRQTYADHRLLHEAPGHLCLQHETEDLASLLQLAMLNGWGGYILTEANYANLFFSHDEYIDLFTSNQDLIDQFRSILSPGQSSTR